MSLEYRWITGTDAGLVEAARSVFDYEVRPEWARRFLEDPSHHLCLAYDDERVAGFVSGVELVHPDKGVEMFLYELGVDDAFRGKGIGRALVTALADLARERGCYGMWVLTDTDNEAALRTYRGGGATETDEQVMLTWRLDPAHDTFADDES